jgi:DNA-binding NtrC family response regulator
VKEKVLIVEDEDLTRWSLEKSLSKVGYEVFSCPDGEEGLKVVKGNGFDLVLLDVKLPGLDGISVLEKIKRIESNTQVIMISAHDDVGSVVKAMRLGAHDYISKPFNLEDVKHRIEKALEMVRLKKEVAFSRQVQAEQYGFDNIIGNSPPILQIFNLIKKIAQSDAATVLIQGESGTGKDLVARTVHYQSKRASHPFLVVNITAVPPTIFESELFGYEKGAFTDAKGTKKGLLEMAQGGTLFLDEIGELDSPIQAKLLRVMENRTFTRVGGLKDIKIDVRIIAATNKDLKREIEQGRFREDLYFRLKVIPIVLPPLRERREDIPLLASYFLQQFSQEFKKDFQSVSSEALKLMINYSWPGNVRELKNLIEKILILEKGPTIIPQHLPSEISRQGDPSGPGFEFSLELPEEGFSLEEMEKAFLKKALAKAEGNQTRAAQLLGISRDVLRYRIKKFRLEE